MNAPDGGRVGHARREAHETVTVARLRGLPETPLLEIGRNLTCGLTRLFFSAIMIGFKTFAALMLFMQWLHYPTPGVPQLTDGSPNLEAPTPRTPDGKPDLSGTCAPENNGSGANYQR